MENISAPKLEGLISKRIDMRDRKKAKTAIVIATYQNPQVLKKHIYLLQKQSLQDFDMIIVYGEKDKVLEGIPNTLHIKEKGRNGCAGAFYIGQKTALEEGYENIISADDDCFPISEKLVEELVYRVEKENTISISTWKRGGKRAYHEYVFHYSCIPKKILARAGLPFYPLFFGGDDIELIERIKKMGIKVEHTQATTYHAPLDLPWIDNIKKRYLYARGGFEAWLLLGNCWRAFLFCFFHLVGAFSFMIFGRGERAGAILKAMINGALMEFGDKKIPASDDIRIVDYKRESGDVIVDRRINSDPDKFNYKLLFRSSLRVIGWIAESLRYFLDFKKYFGKRIIFVKRYERVHLPIMLMAESAIIQDEKTYELYTDRGMIGIILGIIFMIIVTPMSVFAALFLVIVGMIMGRDIKTAGYGVS